MAKNILVRLVSNIHGVTKFTNVKLHNTVICHTPSTHSTPQHDKIEGKLRQCSHGACNFLNISETPEIPIETNSLYQTMRVEKIPDMVPDMGQNPDSPLIPNTEDETPESILGNEISGSSEYPSSLVSRVDYIVYEGTSWGKGSSCLNHRGIMDGTSTFRSCSLK